MKETTIMTTEVTIGTRRRPEKKASALCSSTPLKRLYSSAAMTPVKIPMNWFSILPKAAGTWSSGICWICETAPGLSRVVTTR
ncbi:hypothetical protein D3C75_1162410 [compost metagenome]